MKPAHRYLCPIGPRRLCFLRVPVQGVRWSKEVSAMRRLLRELGETATIHEVDGFDPWYLGPDSDTQPDRDAANFFARLDRAFAGATDCVPRFDLYDWQNGSFVLVRPAVDDNSTKTLPPSGST